jgi:hypothetical protein
MFNLKILITISIYVYLRPNFFFFNHSLNLCDLGDLCGKKIGIRI